MVRVSTVFFILIFCSVGYLKSQEDLNLALSSFEEAFSLYSVKDYEGAIVKYTKAISYKYDYWEAYYNRGLSKLQLGDFHGAGQDFQKVVNNRPHAKAYFYLGFIQMNTLDHYEAIEKFSLCLNIDPTIYLAFFNRGICYQKLGNHNLAIQDFNSCVQINPDFSNAFFSRANSKKIMNDLSGSKVDYGIANRLDPSKVDILLNSGNTKLTMGDHFGAINDYNQVLDKEVYNTVARLGRGYAKIMLNDYEGAIRDYTFCLEKDPNNYQALVNRALSYLEIEDYAKAIIDYSNILNHYPNHKEMYLIKRGYVYFMSAQYESAIEDFDAALKANKKSGPAYYYRAYTNLKYNPEAKKTICSDLKSAVKYEHQEAKNLMSRYCQ